MIASHFKMRTPFDEMLVHLVDLDKMLKIIDSEDFDDDLFKGWFKMHGRDLITTWWELYKINEKAEKLVSRMETLDRIEKLFKRLEPILKEYNV